MGRPLSQIQGRATGQEKKSLNAFIISSLIFFIVCSGLGLFLRQGLSTPYLNYWVAGFSFLVFTVSYQALFSKKKIQGFTFFALVIIGFNFLVQITGGISSPLFPFYVLPVILAAFLHRTWSFQITALILAIEALNRYLSANITMDQWHFFAGFSASLAGVSLMATFLAGRIQNEAKTAQNNYQKLISDARAVDPLAGGANIEALTEEKRQAKHVSMAREREGTFNALIEMISLLLPAHTYALFLDDRADGTLSLRAIQSQSRFITSSAVEYAKGSGLVGISALQNQTQYIQDMVLSSRSLGYYTQDIPIKSFLSFPIAQNSRVVGVLALDSLEVNAFPPQIQDILFRFTPFFIQVIENMKISLELDIRAKNFAALHEMSATLNGSLEISEVLDKLIPQLRPVVPFDFCAFLFYEEKNGAVIIAALKGYDIKFIGNRFPLGQSAILSLMHKQWHDHSTVNIYHDPDLGERGREISLFPFKELQQPIKSLIGRPLVAGNKFIGAVILSSLSSNIFTEYHRSFVDTLSNQVSMVIDNSLLHRDIRDLARTDGLTGLLNHRTFMEKLSEEYKRLDRDPRPFSILLVDIDFFKKVNDTYGHPVGDIALTRVAGVLKDVVRGSDFVARYGGEEFSVGLVDTKYVGAQQMAERVRKIVERTTITVGKTAFNVTLSIGVASYPVDTNKFEDLIGFSDLALYQAKRTGRNQVCLYKDCKALDAQPKMDS